MMGSGYERPIGANTHEATQVFKSSSQAVLAARDKNHRESDFLEGAKRVLKYMQNLWQNNRLCDVVLECRGGNLHAHRVALGAYSEKLSNSFVDYPVTELLTINVKEFSKAAVHVILVFIYTTELNVTDGNVGEVLNCASELEIIYVKNNCIAYLNDNIKVSTVFVFMEIAARHHLIELQKRLDVFLTERFGEIVNTDGFLNIAGDRLMRLLTEHKVSRQVGELAVFLAVVRWVEYRRSERAPLFPTLMKLVNLHLISPQDLINHVEKVGLVTETMESFQMLYSAMALHAVKANGADVFVMSNNRVFHDTTSQNWTTTYPGAPYLGYQAKSEMAHHSSQPPPPPAASEVHPFGQKSPRAPLQRTITTVSQAQSVSAPPPSPRVQFNEAAPAVQLTQGQTSGFTMIPRTRQTQPQSQPQSQPPSQAQAQSNEHHEHLQGGMPSRMGNNPTYTSVAHFRPGEQTDAPPVGGGMLVVVAVGGVELETANPSIPGRCVYQYNPGQQGSSWTSLTSLPHNTHHHGVALLNNKLYVIGGSIYNPNGAGHLGDAISNVNVFDIRTRSWSEASSMIWRRTYLSVAADNDCIYAMGGEDENRNRLDSVERYDPRYNRWTHITNMPSGAKVGHSCAVYNSKLYVVGGYNSRRGSYPVMDNVECFDLNSNQWIIKRNLPQPRCHASLVVAMGSMYLIGGRTKSPGYAVSSMASILRYDELTDVWQHVANMHIPRHDAGCAAIGSAIYVVGGIRSPSPTCLAAVECYDCASGQWRHPVPNLPYTAAGLSCCAVRL